MFTPENFYYVIRENYTNPNNSVMWIPRTNGTKDLLNFITYFDDVRDTEQYNFANIGIKAQRHHIYMYDQEPLYPSIIDRYRIMQFGQEEVRLHDIVRQESWVELLSGSGTCSIDIPIWCHSEYNSSEIRELESNLFSPCYYWYHAFIARDWFRHYQYNDSLQPCDKTGHPYRFLLYARDHSGTRAYRQQMIDQLSIHKSKILYNWDDKNTVGPEYSAKIDINDALKSSIHLVAETLFATTKVYVTEKIFKPMVMSQPFIVYGAPGTLEYLKRYGFQTFDGIWSEDYDREIDHAKRLLMLSDLINDLSSKTNDEFKEIYNRCLPIIDHNRKWFFSQDFMDKCWRELHKNFIRAFNTRRELLSTNPGGQIFHVLNKNPRLLELSRYKSIVHQILSALDNDLRQKIMATIGALKI